METKVTITTVEANGHAHERFFEGGTIKAGTYKTSEADGHSHFLVVEEDLEPGQSATVTTSPPNGDESGHQHEVVVRAIEEDALHEDDEEDGIHRDRDKGAEPKIETKIVGGRLGERPFEFKQATVNGGEVGVFEGHLATFQADTGGIFGVPDRFERGAFLGSLQEHRDRGMRQIRMKDHHGRTVGGFPIELAREDEVGLFVVGNVNLEVQQGREAFALIKQGVLTDMSIGFTALEDSIEDSVRVISKAIVWEGSIIDEPANRNARILEVKAVVPFQDFPLADRERRWDAAAAMGRVRRFTDSVDAPSRDYRRAFVWFDQADPDNFGSYKLPIADVVNGALVAVPRAIFAAAGRFNQTDIPEADKPRAIRHLERYYAKMDLPSPFDEGERQFFGIEEVKGFTAREVEAALAKSGVFSKGAARYLAAKVMAKPAEPRYDPRVMRLIQRDLLDSINMVRRRK